MHGLELRENFYLQLSKLDHLRWWQGLAGFGKAR